MKPRWMRDEPDVEKCDYCGKVFKIDDAKLSYGTLESGVKHTSEPLKIECPYCKSAQGEMPK